MKNETIITLLQLVANTLQRDYNNTKEAKEAMFNCLEEIDKVHIELTGSPLVKRQDGYTVIEIVAGCNQMSLPTIKN